MEPIKLVIVEDNTNDVALIDYTLKKAGLEFFMQRVETEEELIAVLSATRPDLVLSDNSLPRLDSIRALEVVRSVDSSIPFILFSGGAPEERLQELKKQGALHCLPKTEMKTLPGLILQSVEAARAVQATRESEK